MEWNIVKSPSVTMELYSQKNFVVFCNICRRLKITQQLPDAVFVIIGFSSQLTREFIVNISQKTRLTTSIQHHLISFLLYVYINQSTIQLY